MSSEKRVSTQKATSDSRTDGMERMTEGYMTKICSTWHTTLPTRSSAPLAVSILHQKRKLKRAKKQTAAGPASSTSRKKTGTAAEVGAAEPIASITTSTRAQWYQMSSSQTESSPTQRSAGERPMTIIWWLLFVMSRCLTSSETAPSARKRKTKERTFGEMMEPYGKGRSGFVSPT